MAFWLSLERSGLSTLCYYTTITLLQFRTFNPGVALILEDAVHYSAHVNRNEIEAQVQWSISKNSKPGQTTVIEVVSFDVGSAPSLGLGFGFGEDCLVPTLGEGHAYGIQANTMVVTHNKY
eukprot:scaffold3212_cov70-Cyclotella_meneghiniana.AAC.2